MFSFKLKIVRTLTFHCCVKFSLFEVSLEVNFKSTSWGPWVWMALCPSGNWSGLEQTKVSKTSSCCLVNVPLRADGYSIRGDHSHLPFFIIMLVADMVNKRYNVWTHFDLNDAKNIKQNVLCCILLLNLGTLVQIRFWDMCTWVHFLLPTRAMELFCPSSFLVLQAVHLCKDYLTLDNKSIVLIPQDVTVPLSCESRICALRVALVNIHSWD